MQYLYAFLIGGALCTIAQLLLLKTNITSARILVLYVTAGVVLSAIGLYQPLVEFAGAGATVPLTGFGHSLAQGALEAAGQKGVLGAFVGGVTRTAGGIAAAIAFGYLAAVLFKSKTKT